MVQAWVQLIRPHTKALGTVDNALKAARLPPLAWYEVLVESCRNAGIGLRPIEQRLLIAQDNVSRLIDRLETESLVRRESCPADDRGQIVRIKPPADRP